MDIDDTGPAAPRASPPAGAGPVEVDGRGPRRYPRGASPGGSGDRLMVGKTRASWVGAIWLGRKNTVLDQLCGQAPAVLIAIGRDHQRPTPRLWQVERPPDALAARALQ